MTAGYYDWSDDDSQHSSEDAARSEFRETRLAEANVWFEPYQSLTPSPAADLIALLSHWPWPHPTMDEEEPLSPSCLSEEDAVEMRAAIKDAQNVPTNRIDNLCLENASKWNSEVNWKLLRQHMPLFGGPFRDQLGAKWTEGNSLCDGNLFQTKPDFCCGLASEASEALAEDILLTLSSAPDIKLVSSPFPLYQRKAIYPSVIQKGCSNTSSILRAENVAAVGVARALGLLAQLSEKSKVPYQHCVLAIASAGSRWSLYVAYRTLDNRPVVHLVPVLRRSLLIEDFMDRVRLTYILNRVYKWMLGPYLNNISEQMERLWHDSQQPDAVQRREQLPLLTKSAIRSLQESLGTSSDKEAGRYADSRQSDRSQSP